MNDPIENDCPLPPSQQTRNIFCFAALWCLIYLTAPISYVGITHANLLKAYGNNNTIANMPHAIYQWMTGVPILVAWFLPQPWLLKPLLVGSLVVKAAMTCVVALAIGLQFPDQVITWSVVAFGAVFGAANGVMIMTLWEVVRRGVATNRRGTLLAYTFGVGPILACVGSVLQQLLLSRELLTGYSIGLSFPDNYLALFAGAIPVMLVCIFLGMAFIVPPFGDEPHNSARLADILGGLRQFVKTKPVLWGAVAYFLVYSGGNAIFDNVSLHTKEVLGKASSPEGSQTAPVVPSETVGIQNFLRFGFKAIAGAILGWLLAKSHPKAPLLATTGLLLLGMFWALGSSGWWFLLTAGLLGAGELFGAYFPNYISTASAKVHVRQNMAYLNLMGALVGFASVLFGWIADEFGLVASFYAASGILIHALLVIIIVLPARPIPQEPAPPPSGA
jgi:hypothetical protein